MSRQSQKQNEDLGAAALLATPHNAAPDPALAQLAQIMARRLAREEAKEDAELELKKAARKAGALAMQQHREKELHNQKVCPHMKPWGGPAIGGQRDHQHNYHFICLFCSKEWINNELPPKLQIPHDRIGGPNF
jgi:hypothetical protein